MPEPIGNKLVVGKDISAEKVIKALKKRPKRAAKKKLPERKLGPGVTIPQEFLQAEQILLKKLFSNNAGKEKTGKGAGMENLLGMHIGQKLVKGKPTGSLAVIVTVRKKIADQKKVHSSCRIPKQIKVGKVSVPVDVKLGGSVKPNAIGGEVCQTNLPGAGPGSIGCFVYLNMGDAHADFLLSNNHVIGRFCNGQPNDNVATNNVFDSSGSLIAGDPVMCGSLDDEDGFSIDAALAFAGGRNPTADFNQHAGLKFSRDVKRAEVGDAVLIFGSFTGRKIRGVVRRTPPVASVDYRNQPIGREILIRDVLVIQPENGEPFFSKPGDSGSLIVRESDSAPVGLLIGDANDPQLGVISLAGQLTAIQFDLAFTGVQNVS